MMQANISGIPRNLRILDSQKYLKTFRFLDKPRSFVANVGHVGNIFAYRCFLFAIPMLRVCRAAPLKSRFRSQDIITALPVTSWEPPNPRKNDIWLFCLPVNLQCFCSFRFTTQKVQFSQAIARLGGPKDGAPRRLFWCCFVSFKPLAGPGAKS